MVCLNDIPVNGNLSKIRRHVPGGDELHFLFNQCPFFLCYIEFDLYFSFASVHAIAPFHSEGLGHFPTSNFQPTHRRTGGRKYGKGYSFPMLAKKVFSSLTTTTKFPVCQKSAKENAAILRRFNHFMQTKTRELYSPVLSLLASSMPFAVADMIFKSVSLIVSSMVSS